MFIASKTPMKQYFLFAIISLSLTVNSLKNWEADGCFCLNSGVCEVNQLGNTYCQCQSDTIGLLCQESASRLNNFDAPANITEQYSYFFIEFNSSILFYLEIFFCPLQSDPSTLMEVQIDFQDENGSIEQLTNSKRHTLRLKQGQCAIAKYVILPYKRKTNGEFIRLFVRVRKTQSSLQAETNSTGPSPLNITYSVYEFYKMSGESIGELMVVSTLSSMLLICISFTICRRIFLRRRPRFIYQPAVMVRDISTFDDFMPAVMYPLDPSLREDEKECMICLMNVENTLTRTTPCRHLFHKDCIDEWGRKSLTCPMCRYPLEKDQAASQA